MADRTLEKEGRAALTFAPVDPDDERGPITVYAGTGMWDALSTDPDYELVKGKIEEGSREAPAKTKAETGAKTDKVPDPTLGAPGDAEARAELTKLDRDALNSKAADLGVDDPDKLPNKAAVVDKIIDAEKLMRGPAAP